MAKQLVSVRMSDTGRALLDLFQDRLGLTQAGVVELALREMAERKGIPLPEPAKADTDSAVAQG